MQRALAQPILHGGSKVGVITAELYKVQPVRGASHFTREDGGSDGGGSDEYDVGERSEVAVAAPPVRDSRDRGSGGGEGVLEREHEARFERTLPPLGGGRARTLAA